MERDFPLRVKPRALTLEGAGGCVVAPPIFDLGDEEEEEKVPTKGDRESTDHDVSSIGACRPRIFFINEFFCFLEDEW